MIRANQLLAGQYRAKRILGRGGGGKVWDAVDEATGQPVALKELHSAEGFAASDLLRLKREATLLFQLRDPGIVRLHHLVLPGPAQPHAFFVMERVGGETLRARLDRVGTMSVGATLSLTEPLLCALGAAHQAGIVHRDLKPSNIMLTGDPQAPVKLLDFGVALPMLGTRYTEAGAVVGTPAYLTPEQVQGNAVTPATDVHSAAAVIYECLTGRPPFEAATLAELVTQISQLSPLALPPAVPPGLAAAIMRALAKAPSDRPQTADAFREALDQASLPRTGRPGRPSAVRRAAAVIATVIAVAVIGAAAAAEMLRRSGQADSAGSAPPRLEVESKGVREPQPIPQAFVLPGEPPIPVPVGAHASETRGDDGSMSGMFYTTVSLLDSIGPDREALLAHARGLMERVAGYCGHREPHDALHFAISGELLRRGRDWRFDPVEGATASCVVDVMSEDRGPPSAGTGRFRLQIDLLPVPEHETRRTR